MSDNVVHLPYRNDDGSARQMVADNLAAELARKRISGRQAARALGVPQMYVARRVSGEVELSATDLLWFASLLEIPVMTLLAGAGPESPDAPANMLPTDYRVADSNEVVDMFTRAPIGVAV